MKYKGKITDNKDLVTKEYVDGHHDSTKQDVISDLSTIRSGATAGSTAVQPASISDMATQTWVGQQGYLTEHQSLANYSTTTQMNTAISAYHDSTKQDVISDLSTIRSGATAGSTALQSVPATYRTAAQQDLIHDATKENLGKITINGTEYTVAISTTDAGTAGYITFVVDSTNQNSGPSNGPSSYDSGDMDM